MVTFLEGFHEAAVDNAFFMLLVHPWFHAMRVDASIQL